MKVFQATLVVTPYIENGEIRYRLSRENKLNKKAVFGDFLINLKELNLDKCRFQIKRHDGSDRGHEKTLQDIKKYEMYCRVRLGESFIISNLAGTKHLQLMSIEDTRSPGHVKLAYDRGDKVSRDMLIEARKFAQRQEAILQAGATPPVPQVEPGYRGGSGPPIVGVRDARTKTKIPWWQKIIKAIAGNVA